jgi:hypothetical protein
MTVTLERPPLRAALGIPGARAVSLLGPGGAVPWWAGAEPPDERVATAAVALATAAAGLVTASEPGDELGDVLLTSSTAFHVLRLVAVSPLRVAHLTLRRAGANLAMARHEFKSLIDTYLKSPTDPTSLALAPPEPAMDGELPRRRGDPAEDGPHLPDWLTLLGQPYRTDEEALDQILVTLRHL